MMAPRLIELKRVLKPTGSLYLHCDPTESHALKLVLDTIFGRDQFRNEIIWGYPPGGRAPKRGFHRKHDVILYYASTEGTWNKPYTEMLESTRKTFNKTDRQGRAYKVYPGGRQYLDETPGRPVPSWWTDIPSLGVAVSSKERVGYPTQKPVALLKRIIEASSNPGDVVLDPFCGCATAAIAAEELNRQWIGIDLSPKAAELVEHRLHDQLGLTASLANHRIDLPKRTDLGDLPPYRSWKNTLYGEQGGFCAGCREHFQTRHLEVDHVVPQSVGGTDHRSNLQLLCGHCNRRKGAGSMSEFMVKLLDGRR